MQGTTGIAAPELEHFGFYLKQIGQFSGTGGQAHNMTHCNTVPICQC